jgi:hippurate hydrolase
MPVINRIAEFHPEMTAWRARLPHASGDRVRGVRTAGIVAAKLREFAWTSVHAGIAKTGVVGVIRGSGASSRAIGFRADMDALPIEEQTGKAYASRTPGKMHACGMTGTRRCCWVPRSTWRRRATSTAPSTWCSSLPRRTWRAAR